MLLTSDSITSHTTGNTHQLRVTATCKTTNIIYVIQCQRCGKQYVGEMEQALHERINSHRSDVKLKRIEKPVAAHFNSTDHTFADMQIITIERARKDNPRLRRLRENHLKTILKTMQPSGMNLHS